MVTIQNEREHAKAASHITRVLFSSQAIGSAAIATTATVGAIIGRDMAGAQLAGLPAAVIGVSAAFSALLWSWLMARIGRRLALSGGMLVGVFGGFVATLAMVKGSLMWLIPGLLLIGGGRAALQLGRFVAAEVQSRARRGRALATVVLGSTVGSVLGPQLVPRLNDLGMRYGLPELAGIFAFITLVYFTTALLVGLLLYPNPYMLARYIAEQEDKGQGTQTANTSRSVSEILKDPTVRTAMLSMCLAQVVMVMLMVVTAVHMEDHDHTLSNIATVFSSHTFGMFAVSVVTGRLLDHFGRASIITLGASILMLAALLAPQSMHLIPLSLSLFLLGLGWNFCFVGGSTLLSDALTPDERTRIQGINDLLLGLLAAVASFCSGLVFAAIGFDAMSYIGALVSLIPLFSTVWWWRQQPRRPLHSV